jgi:predicted nucleic acid-binding protein
MTGRGGLTPSGRIVVDSSGYYAVSDTADANHAVARAFVHELAQARNHLFTTNYIIAEAHALLLNRLGYRTARTWLTEVTQSPGTTIVRVSRRDERRALEIIRRYDDKTFSLTDATSFAVMERLHIGRAFSFDRDFRQFGFVTLPQNP